MQHDFILLDRSGSMGRIWDEALSSVNAYVKKLADDGVDTGVTLAVFDTDMGNVSFDIVRDRIIPRTWHKVTGSDCFPRGMTPLNDSIIKLVSRAHSGNYDRVAIIIMTDGHENASKEDRNGSIARRMLDECRAKGWAVIMLGADFNNTRQAQFYGSADNQAATMGMGQMVDWTRKLARKRVDYGITGQSATMSFSDEEKVQMSNPTTGGNGQGN